MLRKEYRKLIRVTNCHQTFKVPHLAAVLWTRIRIRIQIRMFWGLLDPHPDPLVTSTEQAPYPYNFGPPRSATRSVRHRYGSEDPDPHPDPYKNVTGRQCLAAFLAFRSPGRERSADTCSKISFTLDRIESVPCSCLASPRESELDTYRASACRPRSPGNDTKKISLY
jgi:hypothetical protein